MLHALPWSRRHLSVQLRSLLYIRSQIILSVLNSAWLQNGYHQYQLMLTLAVYLAPEALKLCSLDNMINLVVPCYMIGWIVWPNGWILWLSASMIPAWVKSCWPWRNAQIWRWINATLADGRLHTFSARFPSHRTHHWLCGLLETVWSGSSQVLRKHFKIPNIGPHCGTGLHTRNKRHWHALTPRSLHDILARACTHCTGLTNVLHCALMVTKTLTLLLSRPLYTAALKQGLGVTSKFLSFRLLI